MCRPRVRLNFSRDEDGPGSVQRDFQFFAHQWGESGGNKSEVRAHRRRVPAQREDTFAKPAHRGDPHARKINRIQPRGRSIDARPCGLKPRGTIGSAGEVG